ncbi:hypothetical protein [Pelomicrobium sp.]|uniref:hypothetical protein n=1 Tax=Pelomicrobium sp. TaxID=2815319 RepID=UPI002FDEB701
MSSSRWELTPARAFVVFFVGVLLLGAVFQWLILPNSPWHAGHGLMAGGDWIQFFDQARELTARLRAEGWRAWELRYQGQWPASLMAAAFMTTGWEHPSAVLPIYAAIYGLAAAVLARLCLTFGLRGRMAWAGLAVLAFPSTVLIWGQPHKDAFALVGFALLAWSWSMAWLGNSRLRWLGVIVGMIAALGLMGLPRPYLHDVVVIALGGAVLLAMCFLPERKRSVARGTLFFALAVMAVWGFKMLEKVEKVALCDSWRPERYIPILHEKVGHLLCYRHGFIHAHKSAASSIDQDRLLLDYRELLDYLPRAAWLALVTPVPRGCSLVLQCKTTSPGGDAKRLAATVEMVFFYVAMLGWLGWFMHKPNGDIRSFAIGLFFFAWAVSIFYVLSSPNEGTLYRERYPEITLWWIGGVAGWSLLLRNMRRRQESA